MQLLRPILSARGLAQMSNSCAHLEPRYLTSNESDCLKNSTLSRPETDAALHRFRTWPEKWVKEGKAPFIHPRLYTNDMPRVLQDAYAACAIYSTKTDQNAFVAWTVIESKATELLSSLDQESWVPLDLLAAIQALLILQFIRLFDGDIHQRMCATHLRSRKNSDVVPWEGSTPVN